MLLVISKISRIRSFYNFSYFSSPPLQWPCSLQFDSHVQFQEKKWRHLFRILLKKKNHYYFTKVKVQLDNNKKQNGPKRERERER